MFAQKIDEFDRAILRILQTNAGLPQREIAALVKLSAPAVQRRIARMQSDGIICATTTTIEPTAMGFPVTIIVEATLTNDRSSTVARAKALFSEAPEIQQCYRVTGIAGFIVILLVPSMEEYERRTARLFADNELIQSYRTIVVLDRVKTGMTLPL
jgi:Lrp/AsnC family leucine-responsive transcriptional regulator